MKLNLVIATAAAAFAMTAAGSAFAASYDLTAGVPTLVGGDDAFADVALTATNDMFSNTFDFDLGGVGPLTDIETDINAIKLTPKGSLIPSLTNVKASFYDLTTGMAVGSVSGENGTIGLASNNDYSVTVSGLTSAKGGSYYIDLATSVAPVPGPAGFLVAIGGMGALLLKRRRSSSNSAA